MRKWIKAMRLRTLPLSLSGIILGFLIANWQFALNWRIFILSIFTTISYQILSNFANDYGDAIKGTDNNRIGEKRTVSSGLISKYQMKTAIFIMIIISLLFTILLLLLSFPDGLNSRYLWVFIFLGVLSVLAAIFYTIGRNPYGYIGMGDIFVFMFFGLLSVIGSNFLYIHRIEFSVFLPASAVGLLSVAVLHLNNMRDIENDLQNNKKTIANILGIEKSKIYLMFLLNTPFLLSLIFILINNMQNQISAYSFILLYFVLSIIKRKIIQEHENKNFDKYLKPIALITLFYSILFGLGINNFFIK